MNKQGKKILEKYLREKATIERQVKKQIQNRYKKISVEYMKRINTVGPNGLTEEYLKKTAKWLEKRYFELGKELNGDIEKSIEKTIKGFTDTQVTFYSDLCRDLRPSFEEMFSKVNEKVLKEMITGDMYKDKITLSKRIWTDNKKTIKTINEIMQDGMISKKNSKLIAKDLEEYVRPGLKREYKTFTIHPKSKHKVEFNSYRLANTYINHAYQTTSKESSKKNPYVEKIIWVSGHDNRVCPTCLERDGQLFDKNTVPLDHPLGRCTYEYYIPKSMEQIATELKDWSQGGKNKQLDEWFNEYGIDFM
nr:MAG TPA: minor capsid protein [Caudoviricetes sp.]